MTESYEHESVYIKLSQLSCIAELTGAVVDEMSDSEEDFEVILHLDNQGHAEEQIENQGNVAAVAEENQDHAEEQIENQGNVAAVAEENQDHAEEQKQNPGNVEEAPEGNQGNEQEWWYRHVDLQDFERKYLGHKETMKIFIEELPKVSIGVIEAKISQKMTELALKIAKHKLQIEKSQDPQNILELDKVLDQEFMAGRSTLIELRKNFLQNFDPVLEKPLIHEFADILMKKYSMSWRVVLCICLTLLLIGGNYFTSVKELSSNQWINAIIKTAIILGGGINSWILFFFMEGLLKKTDRLTDFMKWCSRQKKKFFSRDGQENPNNEGNEGNEGNAGNEGNPDNNA